MPAASPAPAFPVGSPHFGASSRSPSIQFRSTAARLIWGPQQARRHVSCWFHRHTALRPGQPLPPHLAVWQRETYSSLQLLPHPSKHLTPRALSILLSSVPPPCCPFSESSSALSASAAQPLGSPTMQASSPRRCFSCRKNQLCPNCAIGVLSTQGAVIIFCCVLLSPFVLSFWFFLSYCLFYLAFSLIYSLLFSSLSLPSISISISSLSFSLFLFPFRLLLFFSSIILEWL